MPIIPSREARGHLNQQVMLDLCSNEIHLWITKPQYHYEKSLLTSYSIMLTKDEEAKHKRYKFEKDRHNYLVTRVFIRDILSHYINISPCQWQFKTGTHGKPEVVNPQTPIKFNLSHVNDLIICAVTLNDDIGCDVERTDRDCEYLGIAEHSFAKNEFDELLNQSENEQRSRFFEYWTLKESFIKACGGGLAIPLNDFNFEIGPSKCSKSHLFNDNITVHFAPARSDKTETWRSWLVFPNKEHKIAISLKSHSDIHSKPYYFRFFENIPFVKTTELQ